MKLRARTVAGNGVPASGVEISVNDGWAPVAIEVGRSRKRDRGAAVLPAVSDRFLRL